MKLVDDVKRGLDGVIRGRAWLSFPYSVVKKFGEDRAGQLAALVAYYGFFSLFPLLLVAVTALGVVLRNNPDLQERVLTSALASFPIIGAEIRENVGSISGGPAAVAIGIGGALWGGLGGLKAMQNALDRVWGVPYKRQPGFVPAILRGFVMLVVLGVFGLVGLGTSGLGSLAGDVAFVGRAVTFLLSAIVNIGLFLVAYRVLTVAQVGWRDVFPGAVLGGIAWTGLQAAAHYVLGRRLQTASELYGFFGIVLGLLSWIYLGAQVTLFAAEVNVVRKLRLWPRSLWPDPETDADRRTLEFHANVEERAPSEEVRVGFGSSDRAS